MTKKITENNTAILEQHPPTATTSRQKVSDILARRTKQQILEDYALCVKSREASLLGRREVLTGKAKFGIFGDGKEVPQVALARAMRRGDWRSGYYRDQTLMFALGISSVADFFAQLYADNKHDPFSGGRQMNAHFATPMVDKVTGEWWNQREQFNTASDISCTAGQMGRALGLGLASKKFRNLETLRNSTIFSENGNEITVCTIGDASTSEGAFWETMNAAAVLQIPLAVIVWDDGYGISVPTKYQTAKSNISEALRGFEGDHNGIKIYACDGWKYAELCKIFDEGLAEMRQTHQPALFHIKNLTQPQGHSTSGSHERYKGVERLEWERKHDCNLKMRQWILKQGIATDNELESIELHARAEARDQKNKAWNAYFQPIRKAQTEILDILLKVAAEVPSFAPQIQRYHDDLKAVREPFYSELARAARQVSLMIRKNALQSPAAETLYKWVAQDIENSKKAFHTYLYSQSAKSALRVPIVEPIFHETETIWKNGYEIINAFFDKTFEKNKYVFAFGEDVGKIGDVNQGFAGLQEKYGEERIFDCGIREWTIMGQAIGMAMRGLRPIAEIQYLDYLIYALSPLSDDLASLRYRSNGIQQAPALIRTRGHRLEGIWHAGSPMQTLLGSLRGMYICVPRNMTQAAGMYNTLLQSDDTAVVIEPLNGYRQKEILPLNLGEFTVPLGTPDILVQGNDITLVTYGSCVRIALEAAKFLADLGISLEVIDVQTLLPFDLESRIVESLKKTNRLLLLDEDVPGGATGYMMQQILEVQQGYRWLDAAPRALAAEAHRPPYGSDGDYFSKPNVENVIEAAMEMMKE